MLTDNTTALCPSCKGVCPVRRPHVKASAGEMPPMQLAHPSPSPKRKRDQAQSQQMPLLNTALAIRPAATPPRDSPAPADSPRNAVADQLRGMSLIATAAIPMSPLTPTDDVIRKKPKLGAMDVDVDVDGEGAAGTTPANNASRAHAVTLDAASFNSMRPPREEIPETPQAPRPRIVTDIAAFAQPTAFVSSHDAISTPQTSFSSVDSNTSASTTKSPSKPRPGKPPASPPLSALTWQDSEITGHLIGPANDPDDDGTGLNGIGFKPTPAIAYQRAQRRKQQLQEWKARETREARAKRSQRRNRGVSARPSASREREAAVEREVPPQQPLEVPRRGVRFAV